MEELTCPICQELIVAGYSLVPCGHHFCGVCLSGWLATKQDCPNCRQRCTAPPVRSNAVDNIIALTVKGLDEDDQISFNERKQDWEQQKAVLEPKLKDTSKFGGGGGAGGRPLAYGAAARVRAAMQAPYVGLVPGMMGQYGNVPGMDYLLQGIHVGGGGPSPHLAASQAALAHAQAADWERGNHAAQRREILRTRHPQVSQGMSGEQRFRCEYATLAGVSCGGCRRAVNGNDLILGMKAVPAGTSRSGRNSGVYTWYHFGCFPQAGFRNARVVGFENMRNIAPADASRIRERLVQ
jgi:Ring finger domain